jgi:hypothetical protein
MHLFTNDYCVFVLQFKCFLLSVFLTGKRGANRIRIPYRCMHECKWIHKRFEFMSVPMFVTHTHVYNNAHERCYSCTCCRSGRMLTMHICLHICTSAPGGSRGPLLSLLNDMISYHITIHTAIWLHPHLCAIFSRPDYKILTTRLTSWDRQHPICYFWST